LLGTGHHLNQLKKRDILPVDMSLLAGNSFEVHILDADMRLHFVADDERFSVGSTTESPTCAWRPIWPTLPA
jgi:hypothetical protein